MIFYLSGTGNTEWAAQYLAQKTGEQLVFIPDWLRANEARGGETTVQKTEGQQTALQSDAAVEPSQMLQLKEGERIGLCFPVHGWRPPMIVRRFIEQMPLPKVQPYIYALCTAGDNIGETIVMLPRRLLAEATDDVLRWAHISANPAFHTLRAVHAERFVGNQIAGEETAKKARVDARPTADDQV